MGPRFNGVEDRDDRRTTARRSLRLQWGHALMAWKTTSSRVGEVLQVPASMGPRFNGVEDRRGRA